MASEGNEFRGLAFRHCLTIPRRGQRECRYRNLTPRATMQRTHLDNMEDTTVLDNDISQLSTFEPVAVGTGQAKQYQQLGDGVTHTHSFAAHETEESRVG